MTVYFGLHKYIKKRVSFFRGKEIDIKITDPYYFQTDGETIETINEIHIKKAFSKEFHAFKKENFKNKAF